MPKPITPALTTEYNQLFDSCIITPSRYPEVNNMVATIVKGTDRYKAVGDPLGIPWYFVGVIHMMECSCNFNTHLHNGDPLNARTVQVPAGRPKTGSPTFTWEFSANDALVYQGFDKWNDWSIAGMLYLLELYNGTGYRRQGINTPYLWSYSNQYTKGKYVKDGVYDPNAVSKQCGAAVLLRRMAELQEIVIGTTDRISQIKQLGPNVPYNTGSTATDNGTQLQTLLNAAGIALKVDGIAGKNTSAAYFQIAGVYLTGDPRNG